VNQLADELVAAGVPMGGEACILRNGFPLATMITIHALDSAVDATVASVVAAHVPLGGGGSPGPAGPAPAGTGFVKVTGGVLDTPAATIAPSLVAGTAVVDADARLTDARAPTTLLSTGSPTAIGYATGAGGTVVQATSKATGVTLNKLCGRITMHGAALAAAAEVSFVVTNSLVAATDVVVVCVQSVGTAGAYLVTVGAVSAGSFAITVGNVSAGSLSQALVLNFVVLKGVAA
jgi:hypothetical protein